MNRLTLLAFLLAFTLDVHAKDAPKAAPYFDPASVDLKAILPDPPDKAATAKEIDIVLAKQAARTPEEVARIKREVHLDVWLFDTEFGPWFNAKDLPATATLFQRLESTEFAVIVNAKKFWDRPRPFKQDARVHPPIELPKNASYPSGHSTVGNLYGEVLAELAPDLKDKLLARGQQIGDDRVIAGVHFPSDVAAGHTLADYLLKRLNDTPDFQADLAKAKAELAGVRAAHP